MKTPKIFILSADAQGRIDGTCSIKLYDHLPNRVTSMAEADVVLVPVSFYSDYQFNPELESIGGKPWVLVDFMEYGSAWDHDSIDRNASLLFGWDGVYTRRNPIELNQFDDFCSRNQPKLYFKRELLKRELADDVIPIEFPCSLDGWPIEPKVNFYARPLEVFYNWGYSHRSRPQLHGEIFKRAFSDGIDVVSGYDQNFSLSNLLGERKWAAIHTPHQVRQPMTEVLRWQSQSKITVSLPGNGRKCFRHGEAPVNSIMFLHQDEMAWSVPWIDRVNCIRGPEGAEYDYLQQALEFYPLHEIYLASQETVDKYRTHRYISEYVMPNIERVL